MQGYNFTERVRKVLAMAREEAVALNHEYVGTEHILLGLVREAEGLAATVLQNLNIDLEDIRHKLLLVVKPGRAVGKDLIGLPYTSRAKKVLELAMGEARQLNHSYVGTEHLLLGLLAEERGIAAQVLMVAGCRFESARGEILRILGTGLPAGQRPVSFTGMGQSSGALYPTTQLQTLPIPSRFFKVLAAAHTVAERKQRRAISVDHVLIALLEHGEGAAITVLEHLGVSVADLIRAMSERLGDADHVVGPETTVDARVMNELVAQSTREQLAAGSPALSTWHLLLAILAVEGFDAADVLADAGVTREKVLQEATRISG